MKREDAYKTVQERAMEVWKTKQSFQELLMQNEKVKKHLSEAEIKDLFDLQKSVRNVDYIFKQVGLS